MRLVSIEEPLSMQVVLLSETIRQPLTGIGRLRRLNQSTNTVVHGPSYFAPASALFPATNCGSLSGRSE
jgi:hypothetical protein